LNLDQKFEGIPGQPIATAVSLRPLPDEIADEPSLFMGKTVTEVKLIKLSVQMHSHSMTKVYWG